MAKYVYSKLNGAVYMDTPPVEGRSRPEHMVSMNPHEEAVFEEYRAAYATAIANGQPLPRCPSFPLVERDVTAESAIIPEPVLLETTAIKDYSAGDVTLEDLTSGTNN